MREVMNGTASTINLLHMHFDELIGFADLLPTGSLDSSAHHKLLNEIEEFKHAIAHHDIVGAYTEIADIIYYGIKSVFNRQITEIEVAGIICVACRQLACDPGVAFAAALTKYRLRAVTNRVKDDHAERVAVCEMLALKIER